MYSQTPFHTAKYTTRCNLLVLRVDPLQILWLRTGGAVADFKSDLVAPVAKWWQRKRK